MKKPTTNKAPTTISNCTFKMEPFVMNEHMAGAIKALAQAAEANARSIGELASRLAGPPSTGVSVNG